MRDLLDADFLDYLATTMTRAANACRAAQESRARAAAIRARAVETRLEAQHERARARALQEQRWHHGDQPGESAP